MKKITTLLLIVLLATAAQAQVNFIGKTVDSVYSFYAKKVGVDYVYKDTAVITVSDWGTPPLRVASFHFKGNYCTYQEFIIVDPKTKNRYEDALKKNKRLMYDATNKVYADKTNNSYWHWHNNGNMWYLICEHNYSNTYAKKTIQR